MLLLPRALSPFFLSPPLGSPMMCVCVAMLGRVSQVPDVLFPSIFFLSVPRITHFTDTFSSSLVIVFC